MLISLTSRLNFISKIYGFVIVASIVPVKSCRFYNQIWSFSYPENCHISQTCNLLLSANIYIYITNVGIHHRCVLYIVIPQVNFSGSCSRFVLSAVNHVEITGNIGTAIVFSKHGPFYPSKFIRTAIGKASGYWSSL